MSKYAPMNKKVKAKWVKALRTGGYKQGRGKLCTPPDHDGGDHSFCCLGVLENLYCLEKNLSFKNFHYSKHSTKAAVWSGVSRGLLFGDAADLLVEKNDYSGWGFKRIATWIEKNL